MPFSQVKDLLKRTSEYHAKVAAYYEKVADTAEKEAVKQVADYLAGRERFLGGEIDRFLKEKGHEISEAWVQYEPSYDLERVVEGLKLDRVESTAGILETAVELNRRLIKFFGRMKEMAPRKEIEELFSSLEATELTEQKELSSVSQDYL